MIRRRSRAAALLFLATLGIAGRADAGADLLDVQYFRENGYRSCQGCDLRGANLQKAELNSANLHKANLSNADLQEAYLIGADLQETDLSESYLQKSHLVGVKLRKAFLGGAHLQGADLRGADLSQADLSMAELQEADLRKADLQKARLPGAKLQMSKLRGANVANADLSYVDFTNAIYAPKSQPPNKYLAGIHGLDSVVIPTLSETIGVVQLRKLLQDTGLLEERAATYAIEHNKTNNLLFGENAEREPADYLIQRSKFFSIVEGSFRWLAFDLPVGYGLYPGRALIILISGIGIFGLVYTIALATELGSIYRIWPAGCLEPLTGAELIKEAKAEPLLPWWSWAAFGHGLQFSLLSAFNIGFRELNVGNWLARIQMREYELRAIGWVRTVAGIQALLSVYLLAMWALTYFGRPFG